ncbi:MAG: alanine--tRNA ligase [Desulfonatronovibrionaceae bacterium]
MNRLSANQIRDKFLNYFQRHGHAIVPSSPLVPREDPSLLFTNAGMVQFKKVFLGQDKREYLRAVTSQKCLRVGGKHNDLENVGRTARHHTFFEMLGNFSFGDYFKREAIGYAWEFLTREMGLPGDKLYITVYKDDDEAESLWQEVAGVPAERIFRLGEKDNFWSMGDTGPCGPCSEVHFDQGEDMACGPDCAIGSCECDRYLEVWNLVFMQYDRDEQGKMHPLPRPSIDTGMGLERIAAVCQGVYSNFDSDLFSGLILAAANMAGVEYRRDEETDTALRVIADHSRAVAFMISDGILPSNEGRGYVLRRLIRRAFRFGRLLGLKDPFLHNTCALVIDGMKAAYPELEASRSFMGKVVFQEEERFGRTLDKGLVLLEQTLDDLRTSGGDTVSGETAFKLYDTFGFPLDIVNDVAEKQGFAVDEKGFNRCMYEQKERAKAAWKGSGEKDWSSRFAALLEQGLSSEFVGYSGLQAEGRVVFLTSEKGETKTVLKKGEQGYVVCSRTPFYAESGGQVGDRGRISTPSGGAEVRDCQKPAPELTVHLVKVTRGEIGLDQEANLEVEEGKRVATARNHTVTHLLHAVLGNVLGDHVRQAGSLVDEKRLRFDFTHIQAVTREELDRIEEEVNAHILANHRVKEEVMPYPRAVEKGALALFGEKYNTDVRVISVPGVSMELCGGTHLETTGQAGSMCIVSEEAVAAGVRRIEAWTGWGALSHWWEMRSCVRDLREVLRVSPDQLPDRARALQEQVKILTREKQELMDKLSSFKGEDLLAEVREVGGINVLAREVDVPDAGGLRKAVDNLRSRLKSGVILLGASQEGKAMLILYVSRDLHDRFTAPELIKEVAAEIGGGGGGRPDMAQAGGPRPDGLPGAFERLESLIRG